MNVTQSRRKILVVFAFVGALVGAGAPSRAEDQAKDEARGVAAVDSRGIVLAVNGLG